MNFMFECQEQYLTSERSTLAVQNTGPLAVWEKENRPFFFRVTLCLSFKLIPGAKIFLIKLSLICTKMNLGEHIFI